MVQSILSNLAIILLMHLVMTSINFSKRKFTKNFMNLCTVVLFSTAVISMFYLPIEFGDISLDMRAIPLIFLGLLKGGKVTISVLVISSVWCLSIGGVEAALGIIFGMIGPTLLALTFHKQHKLQGSHLERLFVIMASWLISDLPLIFAVSYEFDVFTVISLFRLGSFLSIAYILYAFILLENQRSNLHDQLEKLADQDPLTKLLNKRRFFEIVDKKISNTHQNRYIAMMDIDHFKTLNDTFGHVYGDKVLIELATLLKRYEGKNIKVGRYGGEEFIIYLECSCQKALKLMEGIQSEIKSTNFKLEGARTTSLTVSIGMANLAKHPNLLEAVNQADQNLYTAKKKGRDCLETPHDFSVLKTS